MSEESKQALLSALRSTLIAVGSMLVAKGYVADATAQAMIGAIMVIVPAIWGAYDKFLTERKTEAREAVALNAGQRIADATEGPTPAVAPASVKAVLAAAAETLPPQPPAKE